MKKLRILFTGCTSIQVTPVRRGAVSKIDVPAAIVAALESRGHTVDWHRVTPGDDLSGYDLAWLNMAPVSSLNGRIGAMGTLWVLGAQIPTVAFLDDWQFKTVWAGMRTLVRKPDNLTKHWIQGEQHGRQITHFTRAGAEEAHASVLEEFPDAKVRVMRFYPYDTDSNVLKHRDRLLQAAADFATERWSRGMVAVCPMYGWGDRSIIQEALPSEVSAISTVDPSPTIFPLLNAAAPAIPHAEKREAWALAALMPHDTWMEKHTWGWPVDIFGSRTMVRKFGGERLKTEVDVLNRYNEYAGILSPPYEHAGSGWWRSRFIYSARTRSVLACESGEGAPLGDAHRLTNEDIERLTLSQRVDLAEAQAEALRPHMPTMTDFADMCEAAVYRALEEDKGAS